MTSEEIAQYLHELDAELAAQNVKGEICLYGGAVMCLVFKARPATKDVDAIFEPVKFIRGAIIKIAEQHDLRQDWLNLAVKMFVVEHEKKIFLDLPNLKVFVPVADYILAMKVLAARADTEDISDIKFLIKHLALNEIAQIIETVQKYYPEKKVKPETIFMLEEILK